MKKSFGLTERHVHLGTVGYYADFVIYPALVLGLSVVALMHAMPERRLAWLGVVIAGIMGWTLLEYLMHRFVLHRIGFFDALHDLHHAAPNAMMGTPSWVSLAVIAVGICFPFWLALGDFYGSAGVVGVMVGYYWYICVHHISHHWRVRHRSYLYAAKRHHAQHHHADEMANFGVTTPVWDWLFGSRLTAKDAAGRRNPTR